MESSTTKKKVTPEQRAIFYAYMGGEDLSIEAGAGAGKTSTLRLLANAKPGRRGVYFAFNASTAADARKSFPAWMTCKTAHGLAYGIGRQYEDRLRAAVLPMRQVAAILGIFGGLALPERMVAPDTLASIVMETVGNYCKSADREIGPRHVPERAGMEDPASMAILIEAALPLARKAWEDLKRPDRQGGGRLRFTHQVYLKLWQLSEPRIQAEVVFLDEAQDTNPVVWDVFRRQTHCQRVLVGDRNQSIYGWNGAMNVMAMFEARRLTLSQSFRFGPAVAHEANKWLQALGAELRITGFDRIDSILQPLGRQDAKQAEDEIEYPDAVLCRSNAGAIAQVMEGLRQGKRVALVGGGKDIHKLAEACINLKAGIGTDHPELAAFQTWNDVQEYSEEEAGKGLRPFVKLVDEHGPEALMDAMSATTDEAAADLVVSTAHKAKGREWNKVQIGGDFREPKREPDADPRQPAVVPADDAMLAYVAVTRAKLVLDRGSLAWIDEWLPGAPAAATTGGGRAA